MLPSLLLSGLLALVPPAAVQQHLALERIETGLAGSGWTQLSFAPGEPASRFYAARQFGDVYVFENDVRLPNPFLVLGVISHSGEAGLLGMAFHPDYPQNGYFYVHYIDFPLQNNVIARYRVDPGDPNRILPNSGLILLTIPPINRPHYGGWLGFGPDGYLYASVGDSRSGWSAQDGNNLHGKLLRLDVDNPGAGLNYGIPPGNPFVNDPNVRDEIWALGLRNPWRCAFDRVTGDLWITDVGEASWEEINFQPAGVGGSNYGWPIMEGAHCFSPPVNCNTSGLTFPVHEYDHSGPPQAGAIIGGVLYRGRQLAEMHGRFFFADWWSRQTWSVLGSGGGATDLVEHTQELMQPNGRPLYYPQALCEDADGEMYALITYGDHFYRIVPAGLRLFLPDLAAGAPVLIRVTAPDAGVLRLTGLFISLAGLGTTAVPPAGVVLGIGQARLLGLAQADAAGVARFSGSIPIGLQGRTVWLQAAQDGLTSNVGVDEVD